VFRTINGERTSSIYDIDDIRSGKASDPELRSGDVVVVDNSPGKVALNTALKVLSPAMSVGTAAAAIGD
jgi:polysaccharide export outer membrane protein